MRLLLGLAALAVLAPVNAQAHENFGRRFDGHHMGPHHFRGQVRRHHFAPSFQRFHPHAGGHVVILPSHPGFFVHPPMISHPGFAVPNHPGFRFHPGFGGGFGHGFGFGHGGFGFGRGFGFGHGSGFGFGHGSGFGFGHGPR